MYLYTAAIDLIMLQIGENWAIKLCDFGYARKMPANKKMALTLRGSDQVWW